MTRWWSTGRKNLFTLASIYGYETKVIPDKKVLKYGIYAVDQEFLNLLNEVIKNEESGL